MNVRHRFAPTRAAAFVIASLTLVPALADAEPGTREPADIAKSPGSIWLAARDGDGISFHTNPRIGATPEPLAAASDPLAPATGTWYVTRLHGRTRFDTNPVIESRSAPERVLASR